jgi:hypothetical protein
LPLTARGAQSIYNAPHRIEQQKIRGAPRELRDERAIMCVAYSVVGSEGKTHHALAPVLTYVEQSRPSQIFTQHLHKTRWRERLLFQFADGARDGVETRRGGVNGDEQIAPIAQTKIHRERDAR